MTTLTPRELELLQLVHDAPGLTRTSAAARLGAGSGTVTTLVRSLVEQRLLDEGPAEQSGGRGRPTRRLVPHPEGPVVLAGSVEHERWRVAVVELGSGVLEVETGRHAGGPALVSAVARGVAVLRGRFGARVRGMGLALPGLVHGSTLVDAPLLGVGGVDWASVWPGGGPVVVGNDATLAALGEARRGAATDADLHLHLLLDAGIGGAVTVHGTVLEGANGAGGEFGHMPLGDPGVRCHCGAWGCWTVAVGGESLASLLGERAPRTSVTYSREVIARAQGGDTAAATAVEVVAASLGRGIAGLVNALDADLVTVGGLAPEVIATAPDVFAAAYRRGLMHHRQASPPRVVEARLGEDAALQGAAEHAWTAVWPSL
jgi:predicted NBD/HSP70 family sugar kinase